MMISCLIEKEIETIFRSNLFHLEIPSDWPFGLIHWKKADAKHNGMFKPILAVHSRN